MNYPWYQWFSHITGIYIGILDIILFLMLWRRAYPETFSSKQFRQLDLRNRCLSVAAIFLLCITTVLLVVIEDTPAGFRYIFSAGIILGYSFLRYGKRVEKTVFILSLFYNLHCLSFLIASSVYQSISDALIRGLNLDQADYMEMLYRRLMFGQVVLLLIYTICFVLSVSILCRVMKRNMQMRWQDLLFLSALNIVGAIFAGMVIDLMQVRVGQEVFLLYDNRREMIWKIPVVALLLYIGELSAVYSYYKNAELQEEKEKRFVEGQEAKALTRRLEEAEQFYGSIHRVRHEMKNHMMNIKGLMAGEQYEEVEEYITRLDETIQELDYKYVTGNPVTDVIINDKYRKAQGKGISYEIDFHLDESNRIPVFDMGIILNNLLDNAIEACEQVPEEQRYIRLHARKRNAFFLIEAVNSFDGYIRWEESKKHTLPLSRKTGDEPELIKEHGLGLANVKEIAQRYYGDVNIQIEGKEFRITVMLQEGA